MSDLRYENMIAAYRRRHERARRQRIGAVIVFCVLVLVLFLGVLCSEAVAATRRAPAPVPEVAFEWTGERAEHEARIDAFLVSYFAKCSPWKLARARLVLPVLLDEAEAAGVNPALVAAIVTCESTWDAGALGELGEVGLMQVNRDGAPKTPAENLRAGIAILIHSHGVCGTTLGAVSYYATGGRCSWKGAARRLRIAAKIEGAL